MSSELVVALVGIGGALLGGFLQSIISGLAEQQRRTREQAASWGPILVELMDAGSEIQRWLLDSESSNESFDTKILQRNLDRASNRVFMLCPLELTRSAHDYVVIANALLQGKSNLDALRGAEQDISLVYRRVGGINKSIPIRHRGKRARKGFAPEYR